MADHQSSALLQKIANAIGVPVSAFTDHGTVPAGPCSEPAVEEIAALVEAFVHVKDAEARRVCLEFVRLQRTAPRS